MNEPGKRLQTIVGTAVMTSLAWVVGMAVWLQGREPTPIEVPTPTQDPSSTARAPQRVGDPTAPDLLIPVAGVTRAQLVDTFTQSRSEGGRTHDAIDIMAPRGAPVIAAAAGIVEKLFLSQDGGNTVYIRSPDGRVLYYYAHLDSYAPALAEGEQVVAGTPLGTIGSTGNADPEGPHLHFAIALVDPALPWHQLGQALNPYPLLMDGKLPE